MSQAQLQAINVGIGLLTTVVGQGIALTTEIVTGAKAFWAIIHGPSNLTQAQIDEAWAVVLSQDNIGLALAKAQSGQV